MIIKILRYIFGYVNFRAFGGLADRFLNLCTRDGIPLWNIKNIKGNISASTTIDGYLSIRKSAKKSGMRVMSLQKRGLIFFLKKNKVRVGIFIGAVIFIVIIAILSQFIWSITLVGNVNLEDDYLLTKFQENGVYVGVPISKLDVNEIAKNVVREVDTLSWAAVNRKGTVLVIEVREKTEAPKMYDNKTPTNLIASDDGVILSTDVLYGKEEVKVGSAVTKGDLLISGVISHKDGTEKVIHADGYVKALVNRKNSFHSNDYPLYEFSEGKSRYSIFFFGVKIPFGRKLPDTFYSEHKSFLKSEKNLLPLGIISEYSMDFMEDKAQISKNFQEKITLFNCAVYVKDLLNTSIVRSSNVVKNEASSGVKISVYCECEQEIGVLQEIYVEKTDDNK